MGKNAMTTAKEYRAAGILHDVLDHLDELTEAWQRGVISERDGNGGARSNRNVELASALRKHLNAAWPETLVCRGKG